jgi:hypothetical protein
MEVVGSSETLVNNIIEDGGIRFLPNVSYTEDGGSRFPLNVS